MYQGGVKSTVSWVFEDLKVKMFGRFMSNDCQSWFLLYSINWKWIYLNFTQHYPHIFNLQNGGLGHAFSSGGRACDLCLTEKLVILKADQNSMLNKRPVDTKEKTFLYLYLGPLAKRKPLTPPSSNGVPKHKKNTSKPSNLVQM